MSVLVKEVGREIDKETDRDLEIEMSDLVKEVDLLSEKGKKVDRHRYRKNSRNLKKPQKSVTKNERQNFVK